MIEENSPYDETVDFSKQRSIEKALLILEKEYQQYEQSRLQKLVRPDVSPKKLFFVLFGVIASYIIIFMLSGRLAGFVDFPVRAISMIALTAAVIILFLIKAWPAVIYCVKLYQRYAPSRIRLSCVFEPSCSEYMISAVEKYGAFKGVAKGIRRLLRCRPQNGGQDIP